MTISKWRVFVATILFLIGVPSIQAQDFLKQLEAKLFQKNQESKSKDQTAPATNPAVKESGPVPFELPSVLEPQGVPTPGLLKPMAEEEIQALPAPKAEMKLEPKLEPKSPPVKRSAKPTAPTADKAAADKATTTNANRPTLASPFPRTLPNTITKPASNVGGASGGGASGGGGGFLGLTVESIPGGGFGLTVVEVAADSPAWKAGFRNGDKVIGVSGQAVSTVNAFSDQLTRFSPGTPVKFLVDRRGKTANLIAVLQDRAIAGQIHGIRPGTAFEMEPPSPTANASGRLGQAYFGVNVSDMSDAYRRQFGIPAYRGASVTEVVPNSPAHSAGLKPGDCIVEIEGMTVQSADLVFDTISKSKPGQVISFSYYRGRILNSASVPLASDAEGSGPSPASIAPEMLTPEYVASLQGELERVHSELSETQARLQQLEARLQRMESNR